METGYFFYVGANLIGCNDSASIARVLADKVKSIPEGGVVLGAGFSLRDYDNWSLEDLARIDNVTGNRAAFLGGKIYVDGAFAGGQAWTGWKNLQGNS